MISPNQSTGTSFTLLAQIIRTPANPAAKKVVASVWNRVLLRRPVERIASRALTFATVVTVRRITSKSES